MSEHKQDEVDQAIARRLSGLAAMPVDTSRLDKAMRAQLPDAPRARRRWIAPLSAIAASLIVICVIAVGLGAFQGREAEASAAMMAQMHEDIVSGKTPTMKVDSIDEANNAIAAMTGDFPKLPTPPAEHQMACCMKNVGSKKVACVLLSNNGVPVTMAVAPAKDVESPKSPTVDHDGVTYHVQQVGNLHMVMTQKHEMWICLVSSASADTLMNLAGQIKP